MNALSEIIAAQSTAIHPEDFQVDLIRAISQRLLSRANRPCLLRAPTGAGKTFMISRILEDVSKVSPTMWFWFVPYLNLIQQTEDALAANTTGLQPTNLEQGRNKHPKAGTVILSTSQAVAQAKSHRAGYADGETEDMRSIAQLVTLARARQLKIGLVVDEAHIGLDSQTEFGKFAHWLQADHLIMATATPKDGRITDFLGKAGYPDYENFSVSRDDVVEARLNKRYIETIVYSLRQSMQTITDLQSTVLRQAWRRNKQLETDLAASGIPVVPLLLVQVENGQGSVEKAVKDLQALCKVPLSEIGIHSSDDPDPVMMASIANDPTKRVLVFKQSAGTGFDAPRAFVLASTKSVNDPDFAMQFIGRVMRVTRQIRAAFPKPTPIPVDLDCAYVYLANAEAQAGFEQAVAATLAVKTQLEGQTEKLVARQTLSGAVSFTNRPTTQPTLPYGALPTRETSLTSSSTKATSPVSHSPMPAKQFGMFDEDTMLDTPVHEPSSIGAPASKPTLSSTEDLLASMMERGIQSFCKRVDLKPSVPKAFVREERPEMDDMSAISKAVAARLTISTELTDIAIKTALDRRTDSEVHTNLMTHAKSTKDVLVLTNRTVLAREALTALQTLPEIEEEDTKIVIRTLMQRMRPAIAAQFEHVDEAPPASTQIDQWARDAAYVVIRKSIDDLRELFHEEIASQAETVVAASLPDAMVFPAEIPLVPSLRNIYGVLPPSSEDIDRVASVLIAEDRMLCRDATYELDDGTIFQLARFDGVCKLNGEERKFAQALDRADFVRWWHRNPDRKSWSVALVRGEHRNRFYPDFIICLEHFPGDEPQLRLTETKDSTKDAARKSKHTPSVYGKVLFLTKDQHKIHIVHSNGSLGEAIDFDTLNGMREWLRTNLPLNQAKELSQFGEDVLLKN
ncbi:DEAD/DEAH box helicase family protein [Massilia sp.]|uniref:DEAD/DEAH box helicase n=1 Tax=Massilia sp. TaxID=1882437 RepID=UPI0028A5EF73|nr:DEAD/DEAH box helicase family protein [Massilia sp.]